MEEKTRLDDKIIELAALAEQIGSIALCAANTTVPEQRRELTRANAMRGIANLSEMLSDKLVALSDVVEGVTI